MTYIINGVDVLDTVTIVQKSPRKFRIVPTDKTPHDIFSGPGTCAHIAVRCWCYGNSDKGFTLSPKYSNTMWTSYVSFKSPHDAMRFKLEMSNNLKDGR